MGKIRNCLKRVFGTLLYVLLGLLVFALTTLFLYKKNNANGSVSYHPLDDKAKLTLDLPDKLRRSDEGMVMLYVETRPCAKCSESVILNMVESIKEAGLSVEPIMLCHLDEGFDAGMADDYHERFADYVDLVVSRDDSIRIRNPWIPQGLGFYGIVADSLNRVQYAGSLFDKAFLACCSRQFGKGAGWD